MNKRAGLLEAGCGGQTTIQNAGKRKTNFQLWLLGGGYSY
jgi:hypothetical protein